MMAVHAEDGDPRLMAERDVRPSVAPAQPDRYTGWIAAALLVVIGVALFATLDARRRAASTPATMARVTDDTGAPAPAAPLFIPPVPSTPEPATAPPPVREPVFSPRSPPPQPMVQYRQDPFPSQPVPRAPQQRTSADPALVIDTPADDASASPSTGGGTSGDDATSSSSSGTTGAASVSGSAIVEKRAGATVMRHRATTVPQGTIIPAVLETALDSTRPGLARAVVSGDVRGFDGSNVLIPRGSRLIGEYHADVQPGQNRALVTWTRLIRPDGVTIAIASPAADRLGQIGIKGDVNSHFLAKFGSAILQSALDVGVNLASRAGSGSTTVLAVPSTLQGGLSPLSGSSQVQPTLHVRQGEAITVFVARDLDFTAVESAR